MISRLLLLSNEKMVFKFIHEHNSNVGKHSGVKYCYSVLVEKEYEIINNTKRNDIPLDMSSSGEVLSSSEEYSLGEVVLKSSTSAQD